MTFRIDYFREGVKVASIANYTTLGAAQADVKFGLLRYRADEAQVRDLDLGGKTVARVERDRRDPDR